MINHTHLWLALKLHYWNPPNLWEYEFPPAKYLPKGHPNRIKWEQEKVRSTILMDDYIYNLKSFTGTFININEPKTTTPLSHKRKQKGKSVKSTDDKMYIKTRR